jgi:hypothetical protein
MNQENKDQIRKFFGYILFVIIAISIAFFFIILIFGHTSPPRFQDRAILMIPLFGNMSYDPNPYSDLNIPISNKYAADRFIPDKLNEESPSPYFPPISKYHAFKNFSLLNSDNQYISESWYFNDYEELKTGETTLYSFLSRNGNISRETIDFIELVDPANRPSPTKSSLKNYSYAMTKYESNSTSGYFVVAEKNVSLYNGYYITYYGTIGPSHLLEQSPHIKLLMLTRYNVVLNDAKILDLNPF